MESDKYSELITEKIREAKKQAYIETDDIPEPEYTGKISWPVDCTVGPGLEGAIACESEVSYVNGSKGMLIYRGYDIFDLCAYSTFEEVSYLLLFGSLPSKRELKRHCINLKNTRHHLSMKRLLMNFPVEHMNTMAGLRLGVNLLRHKQTYRDMDCATSNSSVIATDEDSIPMETKPRGGLHSIYEFFQKQFSRPKNVNSSLTGAEGVNSCYHLIGGFPYIVGAIARLRKGHLPLEPDMELSHAANFLYLLTGRKPSRIEERVMDICLILHAEHGMNASTFASLVVASTLSDIYSSIEAGVAALNGPLHGGANAMVVKMFEEIKNVNSVKSWVKRKLSRKEKIMGFGHRVYKAYDPRARVLNAIAGFIAEEESTTNLYNISSEMEKRVIEVLGEKKKIFPNVDFYSGLIYRSMGIDTELFTPIFAVSRIVGWCARVLEYLKTNRIFRPRSIYTGKFNREYIK
jgi:citrate synthase